MNSKLKKTIVAHIFASFNVFNDGKSSLIVPIANDTFKLDKKLAFETEDGKYERAIYAISTQIESSEIKLLLADIADDIEEYALIIQMDNFPPCALRLSQDEEDIGSIAFCVEDNKWIEAGTLMQAKILIGIESLSELLLNWKKLEDYKEIYKYLIGYLNHHEV